MMTVEFEEEEKPIVKYDRQFSDHFKSIFSLSKTEADLFNTVLSIIRERKSLETTITAKDIIERSQYLKKRNSEYTIKTMVNYIDSMSDRVGGMYYLIYDEEKKVKTRLYLFDMIGINEETGDLEIKLGRSFSKYFFDIENSRPFTRYYLINFLGLKSKYAKNLYRMFLDNYGGLKITLDKLFENMGIKNASSQRSFINRLPIFLKQIEATGDFRTPICYTLIRRPGEKKNKAIRFTYEEVSKRITEVDITGSTYIVDKKIQELVCPYCGDTIVESENKNTKKKFWHHKNWKEHQKCPLKNCNTLDEMQAAIDDAWQLINKKKAEKQREKEQKKQLEKSDLPEDFDPSVVFSGMIKSNIDADAKHNSGDNQNYEQYTDIVLPEPPFPKG